MSLLDSTPDINFGAYVSECDRKDGVDIDRSDVPGMYDYSFAQAMAVKGDDLLVSGVANGTTKPLPVRALGQRVAAKRSAV